jgi:hypothetical protein
MAQPEKEDPTQINAPGQVGFGRNHEELQVATSPNAAQVVSALLGKSSMLEVIQWLERPDKM